MAALPDSIPVDKVESLVCCSVCLERLQDPRTLPCFHSYCKHCLENYVAKHREKAAKAGKKIEEFECPCCRTPFSLKEHEEVTDMRGSHFIRNMVDVLNAERTNVWKCSNHSDKASCCRCVSCEVFLCEECLKIHQSWPGFKSHAVLTIEELKKPENQSKITDAMRCKEHTTKKLKFYCESCQVLICRYCMDFNHVRPEHVCHPVEKVAEKHRQTLQTCSKALDEKQAEVKKSLKDFTDTEKALKIAADGAKEEISKQKNDIIKAVEDVFKRKVNQVDQMYSRYEEKLNERKNKVKSILDIVKCTGNLSNNLLQKGSDEEIIESCDLVQERLETVKKDLKDHPKPFGINQRWFAAKQIQINMISKIFGTVFSKDFLGSTILQTNEYDQPLHDWFYKEDHIWHLCYRASTDGWYAKDFHAKCDDKGTTVVLVKVKDYIFGGFTDTNWGHKENGLLKAITFESKSSFIFSLSNKDNLAPFKSSIVDIRRATVANEKYGAVFGNFASYPDLCITNHPPTKECYAYLGSAYKLPGGYVQGTDKAKCLLAGSFNFTPEEIEVFYHVKK